MPSLFSPIRLGALEAPNRIFMAPLTRARGDREFTPTPVMAEYYAQRAGAGLIISEAIGVSRQGLGWPHATGLFTDRQEQGWAWVVAAVQGAGGRILAQLWHMGRQVHPDFLDGELPVGPSPIAAPGQAYTFNGRQARVTPRAIGADEIPAVIADYRQAAVRAMRAGFDGVQVHCANGYLIDQFLHDGSNQRQDAYGGSLENRCRLMREVVAAVVEVAGPERTSVRLSPSGGMAGMRDSDPQALFLAVVDELARFDLAFLDLHEPGTFSTFHPGEIDPIAPMLRKAYPGALVLNCEYDKALAEKAIEDGEAEAISFGRAFIGNPDLPRRLLNDLPLAGNDKARWYTQGRAGYADYSAAATA